nr:CalS14-like putative dehydratase [uncultured bacterium]
MTRVPFDDLHGWGFDRATGNLVHETGRFFSVEGLHVRPGDGTGAEWWQPIIHQPDIAILGILATEIDGVLHFLMQAKKEPGNVNRVQLSPTVQATSSNYTRLHGGSRTPYVEYFTDPGRGRVIVDVLQSEQGAWFYRKRNRNVVVEVSDEVPVREDFRWLTLGQILALARVPNLVNMDARTVLACLPFAGATPAATPAPPAGPAAWVVPSPPGSPDDDGFRAALRRSLGATTADAGPGPPDVAGWLADRRQAPSVSAVRVGLDSVVGWYRSRDEIARVDGGHFAIIGVRVTADNREVASWTQPLLAPRSVGVIAMLVRRIDGVLHALVRADVQPGYVDAVEIGPTVQYTAASGAERPPFLDLVLQGPGVRYATVLSEEGGRFHQAQNRYLVVEVGEEFPLAVPPDFAWLTVGELTAACQHSHQLNIEARTLLFCLYSLW